MTEIRKADFTVRRYAVLALLLGTCVGALLILCFERYHIELRDWILSEPEASAQRAKLVLLGVAALLLAPLLGFAAYVWSVGSRAVRSREFPPAGVRVIRDTTVIRGESAVSRGRLLEALALGCGIAAVALALLLWRLASLSSHAA